MMVEETIPLLLPPSLTLPPFRFLHTTHSAAMTLQLTMPSPACS